ncbi:MAG: alpha/beta hydrolase, partial [Candidatus Eremiobacteraeota bacterium]|nr:alpha/beta hydrolase [Candidatus Eremiobacteraeota bacterium]
ADVAAVQRITQSLRAGNAVSSVDQSLYMLFRPSVQPYLMSWFRFDPAVEIAKLSVPILIVQGTTDFQVGISDAQRLQSANPHAKLALIQGMNHILRDAPADRTANLATYAKPSLPLNAAVVRAIAGFILNPR